MVSLGQRRRFRFGFVIGDVFRRLAGGAIPMLAFFLVGWGLIVGVGFAYQAAYTPLVERFGIVFRPGSATWTLQTAVSLLEVVAQSVMATACTRVAIELDSNPVRRFLESGWWAIRGILRITAVVLILRIPQLVVTMLPQMSISARALWASAAAVVYLLVLVVVGPFGGVLAMERLGPFSTIARSARLVNRHRWSFVAVWLIFSPLLLGPVIAITVFSAQLLTSAIGGRLGTPFVTGALSELVYAAQGAIVAAIYVELVQLKDRHISAADVFD